MTNDRDNDIRGREYDAAEIERVESAFLEHVHLYITDQIADKALVNFCTDHILSYKAARFIAPEMYSVMTEVAIFATELTSTINRLEQLLKDQAVAG